MVSGSHGRERVLGYKRWGRERADGFWRVRPVRPVRPVRMGRSRAKMPVASDMGRERVRTWLREMLPMS